MLTSTLPHHLVVIDCETTGLGSNDRIIEIAVLTLDPRTWEPTDEYETLINPERDIGPVGIHGITASRHPWSRTRPPSPRLSRHWHTDFTVQSSSRTTFPLTPECWVTSSSGLAWTLTLAQGCAPTEPPAANSLPHVADTK